MTEQQDPTEPATGPDTPSGSVNPEATVFDAETGMPGAQIIVRGGDGKMHAINGHAYAELYTAARRDALAERQAPSVEALESDSITSILPALIKARSEWTSLATDARNTHNNSKYATLANVLDMVRPGLTANGLLLMQQTTHDSKGGPVILTRLLHTSGEWFATMVPIMSGAGSPGPQQFGSGMTYARRYGAVTVLGLAAEDDDGELATKVREQRSQGGVYQPPERTAEQLEQAAQAKDRFTKRIEAATSQAELHALGSEIASHTELTKDMRGELITVWQKRNAELKEQAAQATLAAEQQRRTDPPADTGPEDVHARKRPAAGSARRTAALQQATAAHPDSLYGAALAAGLRLADDDDVDKLTAAELERIVLVTPEDAADAIKADSQ